MSVHDNVFKLSQLLSSQGMHGSDLLMEVRQVTLASGTAECPTVFKNGYIVAAFITDNSASITAVNSTVAFATDLVVSSGAITINGPTASTLTVSVLILGRLEI